jgi:hypothetical protein
MLPRKFDTTLAHKAINLMRNLTGTDKRVAATIIDHFNRKTGQCDPSHDRIAGLLRINRRTVIRSVKAICKTKILQKFRNGGYSQRNSYIPNWALFREMDAEWIERFRSHRRRTAHASESPDGCQSWQSSSDKRVTQTLLNNQSNKTSSNEQVAVMEEVADVRINISQQQPSKNIGETIRTPKRSMFASTNQPDRDHARIAAQRRWMSALNVQFAGNPEVYGQVLDVLDDEVQENATRAEMRKRGAGIAFVLDCLKN